MMFVIMNDTLNRQVKLMCYIDILLQTTESDKLHIPNISYNFF